MSLVDWFRREFPAYEPRIPIDLAPPLKPRLASVLVAPSRDEFDRWREDPVTLFVMAGLTRNAEECGEHWMAQSWEGGIADETTLMGLRERADTLRTLVDADYTAWCEVLGVEPEGE